MGSTRLPGKTLKKVCGIPILEHIVQRIKASLLVDKIIVATTIESTDDELVDFCKDNEISCFRGSEEDVLDRFYKCAVTYDADIIIRVTADDPFKDPQIIDRAIRICLNNSYDYVSNTIHPTYPEGIDIEVFTMEALKTAHENSVLKSEREHVTPYIWKNGDVFKLYNFEHSSNLSKKRWTLDTEKDFLFVKRVYEALYNEKKIFLMSDILSYLTSNPEVELINSGHIRNEGYIKSLREDDLRGLNE